MAKLNIQQAISPAFLPVSLDPSENIFCKNTKVFTVTFNQFNASLLNRSINFLLSPNVLNGSVFSHCFYLLLVVVHPSWFQLV